MLPKKIPTMVGGAHPTFLPEDTLQQTKCTFVIRGEAETVLRDVMDDMDDPYNMRLKREYVGQMAPVDLIPEPARNLVNLKRYTPGGDKATPVYTSRGCPFNCRFCSKITGNKYREFSVERVIDEVRDVVGYGFKKVVFGDDNLGINPSRLHSLLDALTPIGIKFRLNMDARHPDQALFEHAYTAGCTDISFGIESGSQKILDAMNKQTTVTKNRDAIKLTQKCGMEAKAYFMVNYPGETEETVKETLKFVEEARPDRWMLSAFSPLPGSYVYIHPKEFGITSMSKNWSDYYLVGKDGKFNPCFTTEYLTYEKQIELHDMMFNGLKEIIG